MTEFELKFQVPADAVAAVEAALRRGTVTTTRLRARYFDTQDGALARNGLVLRLRQEGRRWVQAAKGQGPNAFLRLEHEARLPSKGAQRPDLSLHAGHPLADLLEEALKHAQGGLQQVFETDITRLTRVVEASGAAVEIALDRGQITAGERSQGVLEIEFELKQGSLAAAVELARSWCHKHGLWLDPLPKSGVGQRLAAGMAEPPPEMAAPVVLEDRSSAGLLAAVIDSGLRQILGNARELASGAGGDGHIHQLRVGLRRLRTVLRELDDSAGLKSLDPQVEPALRELFGRAGEHRDRSTLLPALQRELAEAGAPIAPWQPELPDIGAAVRDPAFQSALLQLVALVQEPQDAGAEDDSLKATRKSVRARLRKLHRQVEQGGRKFEQIDEPARHQMRKRLKRLRYLSELARPLFSGRAVDRFTNSLKGLQDALGHYQDAAAGRQLFAQRAVADPGAWFAVGWLAAREREIAADCARAWRKSAAKAQPFW